MRRKLLIISLIFIFTYTLSGCSLVSNSNSNQTNIVKNNDSSTYKYSSNPRFVIVSLEQIDDGTNNGISISTIVDRETKVMYIQTEKFLSGYGIGLQPLLDKDGKPLLYTGPLKEYK